MDKNENISVDVQNNSKEIITFFAKDSDFVYVYKKTEKLTTAIYLVTNLFSDVEPMKWTLRKKSADILSFILCYKNVISSKHKDFCIELKSKVLELISFLEVASRSGLVSFMNFSIIEQEFSSLIKIIDSHDVSHKENQIHNLSKSFFNVPNPVHPTEEKIKNTNDPKTGLYSNSPLKTSISVSQNIAKPMEDISDKDPFKRTNRQEAILALLKKKGDLNIKDIALVIRGCGEKTIQRELVSLIGLNLIKKTGERRWSRYSINSN